MPSYDKYLKARDLQTSEYEAGTAQGLSATIHFRERDDEIAFKAQKCGQCGALQFPAQRVCESCYAKDDFEQVRLSDKVGAVVTYTLDFFFPTPDPPTVVTICEIDGARVHLQMVNVAPMWTGWDDVAVISTCLKGEDQVGRGEFAVVIPVAVGPG